MYSDVSERDQHIDRVVQRGFNVLVEPPFREATLKAIDKRGGSIVTGLTVKEKWEVSRFSDEFFR